MSAEAFQNLQKSVENAGSQLDTVASRLSEVEKNFDPSGDSEVDNASVMELLESMTEVKNEYQNLRKDLLEVQQLQKEMTNSLKYQMKTMTKTFNLLKKRIELRDPTNY